jgi:hypothetical protein
MSIGDPPRPVPQVNWEGVEFLTIEPIERCDLKVRRPRSIRVNEIRNK